MQWIDDFSVKVKDVDEQHKNLAVMFNALHEVLLANKGQGVHTKSERRIINSSSLGLFMPAIFQPAI